MKRRIISLLLVVVMLTFSLVSCGYSYANDDMKQYATFDKDGFLAGLQSIVIKDGEFTTNEDTRALKVLDSLYEALAAAVAADSKSTEGALGEYDVLYYVYFCTVTVGEGADAKEYVVFANEMEEKNAKNLQLGLSDLTGVKKKIAAAVKELNLPDIKDHIYATTTTGKTETGDKVYVSYTKTYTKEVEGAEVTVTENYKYDVVTVGDASATNKTFADLIFDATVGTKFTPTGAITEDVGEVEYSDVTVHWIVDSGRELVTVKDVTYTSTKNEAPATHYPETNGKIDLKDKELTYHVYPVYYKDVSELSATSILNEILNTNLSTSSLEMFKEDAYKTLIDELKTLFSERATEKTAVTNAQKNVDTKQAAYDSATDDTSKATKLEALQDAKTALQEAKDALAATEGEITTKIAAIFAVDTTGDGADDLTTEQRIVKDYKQLVYDNLESAYNNEIRSALAEQIYKLITDKVTVNSVPEKALDEAYDILFDSYKAVFYTEDDESSKKSNYAEYNGDFKAFLTAKMKDRGATDYATAKAAVRKEAEEKITPIVKIFAVAQAIDGLLYTDKEYKEEVKNLDLGIYEETYGETNIRAAKQIDKIIDFYLEMDPEDIEMSEDTGSSVHDHSRITEIRYKDVNGTLVLPFTKIVYVATEDGTQPE